MSYSIDWRVFCLTDNIWTYGTLLDTDGDPTECFENAAHTINSNSIQTIKKTSIMVANDPTTGALSTLGGLGVAKNVVIGGNDSGDPNNISQIDVHTVSITDTITATSGTQSQIVFNKINASTLNASNSSVTTTDAATVYITGAPIAGTNQTITNSYGLLVDGNSRINGTLNVDTLNAGTVNVNIKTAYIRDEKVIGTNGGTFTSGVWQVRELNTITTDAGSGISLAANQITLTAGTYIFESDSPAYDVNSHASRLYNVTDATVELIGTSSRGTNTNFLTTSLIKNKIVVTSTKVFEIQHRAQVTRNSDGLGYATGLQTELYTHVFIMKLMT